MKLWGGFGGGEREGGRRIREEMIGERYKKGEVSGERDERRG
jgi:hypothetical protein